MGDDWWAFFAIVCQATGKLAPQSPAGISWGAYPGVQNSLEGFQFFFLITYAPPSSSDSVQTWAVFQNLEC